jgi:FkbM family methyltransferase
MLYRIIYLFAKVWFKNQISVKQFYGSKKILYYKKSQHLGFLFQRSIKYEYEILTTIKPYVLKGGVVFDIGANIGQYAIPFSELVGNEGKVYCFEPDPENFSFLQLNTTMNACNNVCVINQGVGDLETNLSFYRDTLQGGRMGSFIKSSVGSNFEGFEIKQQVKKLDSLIKTYGVPDFIKVDVEGFEVEVVKGLTVDFENSVWLIEVRQNTKEFIFNYFYERGYECRHIENSNVLINNADEIPEFANLIFKKNI